MCVPTHIGAEISNTKKYSVEVDFHFLEMKDRQVWLHIPESPRGALASLGSGLTVTRELGKGWLLQLGNGLTGDRPGDVHWLHFFFHFDVRNRRPQDRGRSAAHRG